jgi:DNA-binding MarR family transcriptional regulator
LLAECKYFGYPFRVSRNLDLYAFWAELEKLGRILGRVGPDEVCCEGLTIRQCAILRTLAAGEGARLSDLASSAGITQSAMTRAIEKLERRGLVQRVRGAEADGRSATVGITASGRKLRGQLDELMLQRARAIFEAVPDRQRASVLKSLQILNAAMLEAPCCPLNEPVATRGDLPTVEAEALMPRKRFGAEPLIRED